MKTLGERLRHAIEIRGVGVNELDEAIGRTRYVSKIVNNHRTKPGAATLQAISKHLRIDHAWLVTGEGIAPTKEDDLSPRDPTVTAPIWRRDPDWATERDLALQHRKDPLPAQYIEEMGDMVVTGHRRPTWSTIIRMAEACWLADIAEAQRVSAAPQSTRAAVDSSPIDDDAAEAADASGPSLHKSSR